MDYLATMHSMNIAGTGYGEIVFTVPQFFDAVPGRRIVLDINEAPPSYLAKSTGCLMAHACDYTSAQEMISCCLLPLHDHPGIWSIKSGGRPCLLLPDADHACAGSYFVLSMLDRLWHRDLTQDEAVELMEKGIEEVGSHLRLAYAT